MYSSFQRKDKDLYVTAETKENKETMPEDMLLFF